MARINIRKRGYFMKRFVAIMTALVMLVTMLPASEVNAASKIKTKLNKNNVTIYVGEKITLKLKNNKKKVKWISSNKKIATVGKKGKVTGKKAGKVRITAKVGKKKYTCRVTVKKNRNNKTQEVPTTPSASSEETNETKKEEEITTNTSDYGDSGEDWVIYGTADRAYIVEYWGDDENVVIPNKIQGRTIIGLREKAFYANKNIKSVIISEGITDIGEEAFCGCTNLQSVTMSEGVKKIGDECFYQCSKLSKLTLSDGIVSIGASAFYQCSELKSVALPDSIVNLGEKAFYMAGIEEISLSKGLTIVEDLTFYKTPLKEVVIPDSVTVIGYKAFSECKSLSSVVIPYGVIKIKDNAFVECSILKKVFIPISVTEIEGCYYGDPNTAIVSRNTVIQSARGAYAEEYAEKCHLTFEAVGEPYADNSYIGSWSTSETADGIIISEYIGNATQVTVPSVIRNKPVIEIGSGAFQNTNIKSVTIPEGVTKINQDAFNECSYMTKVVFPKSLTYIGTRAFQDCINLRSINSVPNLQYVGDSAFCRCECISKITMPKSVEYVGYYAFAGCKGLVSVIFEGEDVELKEGVFAGCTSLTDIVLPSKLTEISNGMFSNCSRLTSLYIPESVQKIGYVYGKTYLTTIRGVKGSYAEGWAIQNGYIFEEV